MALTPISGAIISQALNNNFSYLNQKDNNIYINVLDYGAVADGVTDCSSAIQAAVDYAFTIKGTVFFPAGTYRVNTQIDVDGYGFITLKGAGGLDQTVINFYATTGTLFNVASSYQVKINNLSISMQAGSGNAQAIVLHGAGNELSDCIIRGNAGNTNVLVAVDSGATFILRNRFVAANASSYALQIVSVLTQPNINSFISDNTFAGGGKGVIVNSANASTRVEGLTVSRNIFINEGMEQLTVTSILRMEIVDNLFDQSTNLSIWATPSGLGINGLFITGNYISPAQATLEGTAVKFENNAVGITNVVVSDNMIIYTGYGVNANANVSNITVNDNVFSDVNHDSISINNSTKVIITNNQCLGANYNLTASDGASGGEFIITDNMFAGVVAITQTSQAKFHIKDNIGFISENSGTATISSGSTTKSVTHGIYFTPNIKNISITPTNSLGNATKYFIGNVTSGNFDITVNADPGTASATFVWNIVQI